MTKAVKAPLRGDVVILDFNPQAGHEQAGTRPALVISADIQPVAAEYKAMLAAAPEAPK